MQGTGEDVGSTAYLSAVLSRRDGQLRTRPRRLAADHQDLPSDGYAVGTVARGRVWDAVPAALLGQASGRRRAADFPRFPPGTSERCGRSGVRPS